MRKEPRKQGLATQPSDPATQATIDYYDEVWLPRLQAGHNPLSRAIHYGLTDSADVLDRDRAKLKTNLEVEKRLAPAGTAQLHALDAGCGVGGTAIDLALRNPGWRLTGVNVASKQVEFGRSLLVEAGLQERVELMVASYADLPCRAETVDAIYFIESLCHAQDLSATLMEARRVLRPGGRIVVIDFERTQLALDDDARELYDTVKRGFAISGYFDEGLEAALGAAELDVVEVADLTERVGPCVDASARRAPSAPMQTNRWLAHRATCRALPALLRRGALAYRVFLAVHAR